MPQGNNNTINEEKSNFVKKLVKNNKYSTFSEKFFANKTMKNYFLMTKKNKQSVRKYINRVNSDLAKYHKDLPKIQNDYFNFNAIPNNKNHFSSQIYSNKNFYSNSNNSNKRKNEYYHKIHLQMQ